MALDSVSPGAGPLSASVVPIRKIEQIWEPGTFSVERQP
jgi:hypothetical protein